MTLPEILTAFARDAVCLWWDNEALRFRAPRGTLTPVLKQALRQHKPTLRTWR
jgi:hypothetical protein